MQRKTKQYISKHANDPGYTEYDRYFADVGQQEYENNRLHCGAKYKITAYRDFVQYAEEMILSEKQSPDAVVGYVKKNELFAETVTTKTFTERKTGKAFVLKADGKTAEATFQAVTKRKRSFIPCSE